MEELYDVRPARENFIVERVAHSGLPAVSVFSVRGGGLRRVGVAGPGGFGGRGS